MNEIHYKLIRKKELAAYLASDDFLNAAVWPISKARGLSYCKHPQADDEDVLLFLALQEGKVAAEQLVGYLGIFPQQVFLGERQHKLGFYSCMWVNPATRGMGIAKQFMQLAFKHWDNKLMVTEFTPAAKGLYDKTGHFGDLLIAKGLRCYLRTDFAEIVPRKLDLGKGNLRKLSDSALEVSDRAAALILKQRQAKWRKPLPDLQIRFPKKLQARHHDFMQKMAATDYCRRTADELNWIMENPWLVEGPENADSAKYHFSSVAKQFHQEFVEICDGNGQLIGLVMLSFRNAFAKIPHAYFAAENCLAVLKVIYKRLIEMNAHTFLVFHAAIVTAIKNEPNPFLHRREAIRHYIISKSLLEQHQPLPDFSMQDGNGDAAFT